uniref:Secreted protein n=1 Tax=Parascaris univalens TaxID=6257 RepID=A0A914ZFW8_PARUN
SFVSIFRMCSNLLWCTVPVGIFRFGSLRTFVSSVYEELFRASKNAKSYRNNFLNKGSTFNAIFSASCTAQQRGGGHISCHVQVFHINTSSSSCTILHFPAIFEMERTMWSIVLIALIQGFCASS